MEFRLTEEQLQVEEMVRNLSRKEFAPGAAAVDEESRYPAGNMRRLAGLGLSDVESKLYEEQLSTILEYAKNLQQIDTEGIPPTSHAIPMNNVLREDRMSPCGEVEDILLNAPEKEGKMFKVPKILE